MKNIGRNTAIWIIVVLSGIAVLLASQTASLHKHAAVHISYSEFVQDVDHHKVKNVVIRDRNISGTLVVGSKFSTYAPEDPGLVDRLNRAGVNVIAQPAQDEDTSLLRSIGSWIPMMLLIGLGIMIFRQMQSGGAKGAMGFGKSRAKLLNENTKRVTFKDVAGIDEAKAELEEVVDFLKDPKKFTKLGGKIPKGVLLVGPPGTGKTLLARSVAGEANVPFFSISGSDFVEMFVGVGASRVRDMFEQGKKSAPCIIFIDEIDAVGRHRGAGLGGGNDEREQTLNQMLVEMDGFESSDGVILIAATNRPDVLDPALLRPGRFDRQVVVSNPDVRGREKILRVHSAKVPLSSDTDLHTIARGTPGFSGADLANLVNEAALFAARKNAEFVAMKHFEEAKDKVMMGAERRSMVMTEEEKKTTAYHEGGHAICAWFTPGSDTIHKATIVPRGQALGMVMTLPEKDNVSYSRKWCLARLIIAMAGRVSEEIIFGHENVSAGASGDIKHATDIARRMVAQWGMSDKLGMVGYDSGQEVFLGHSMAQQRQISEQTAREVDKEVKVLIDEAYNQARNLLLTHIDDLHRLAKALLEHETLTGKQIDLILTGKELPPESFHVKTSGRRGSVPEAGRKFKKIKPTTATA